MSDNECKYISIYDFQVDHTHTHTHTRRITILNNIFIDTRSNAHESYNPTSLVLHNVSSLFASGTNVNIEPSILYTLTEIDIKNDYIKYVETGLGDLNVGCSVHFHTKTRCTQHPSYRVSFRYNEMGDN